jgi:hypothetical protein
MAAYAVSARIERAHPHVARWTGASQPVRPAMDPILEPEAVDLVGRPLAAIVTERWTRIRESWAQTTFFLFDPESWR